MTCVVADSGPLIALGELNCLHVPRQLWGVLLVPQTVLNECVGLTHKTGAEQILRAVEEGVIQVRADALPPMIPLATWIPANHRLSGLLAICTRCC
jgi:predicted nucleic acid-binding protein